MVVGNVNLETSLSLDALPLPDASSAQPHKLELSAAGVGFNLAAALQTLGTEVRLASVVVSDMAGEVVRAALEGAHIDTELQTGERTARSLVVSDRSGARHVHTDLGGVAESVYSEGRFRAALPGCDLALLTNIGYSRPLLEHALRANVPISTDLHAIRDLDNPYDEAFLAAATLLFFSGEHLPDAATTVTALRQRYNPEVIVVGLGAAGALLAQRGQPSVRVAAFPVARVVNTVGAGDALHAAFCHFWLRGDAPLDALRYACAFAAHTVTTAPGGQRFLSEADLRTWLAEASENR